MYKALTKDLCFRTRQNREGIHRLKGPSSACEAYPALEAAAYGNMRNAAGPGRYPDLRIARLSLRRLNQGGNTTHSSLTDASFCVFKET